MVWPAPQSGDNHSHGIHVVASEPGLLIGDRAEELIVDRVHDSQLQASLMRTIEPVYIDLLMIEGAPTGPAVKIGIAAHGLKTLAHS